MSSASRAAHEPRRRQDRPPCTSTLIETVASLRRAMTVSIVALAAGERIPTNHVPCRQHGCVVCGDLRVAACGEEGGIAVVHAAEHDAVVRQSCARGPLAADGAERVASVTQRRHPLGPAATNRQLAEAFLERSPEIAMTTEARDFARPSRPRGATPGTAAA